MIRAANDLLRCGACGAMFAALCPVDSEIVARVAIMTTTAMVAIVDVLRECSISLPPDLIGETALK
jgi:hypothetical protein